MAARYSVETLPIGYMPRRVDRLMAYSCPPLRAAMDRLQPFATDRYRPIAVLRGEQLSAKSGHLLKTKSEELTKCPRRSGVNRVLSKMRQLRFRPHNRSQSSLPTLDKFQIALRPWCQQHSILNFDIESNIALSLIHIPSPRDS